MAIGVFWRLHDLPGQILLDDEWHSLNFVIGRPFFSLFFAQGEGANAIPQNIYSGLLLQTLGGSELLLRMPSLLLGLLALIVFPPLVEKAFNRVVAVVFAYLLAFSPVLTFYSRLCRPYAAVCFFGFLSFLFMVLWLRRGKAAFLYGYAFSGFIAMYHHLYAAVPVLTPLLCLSLLKLLPPGRRPAMKSAQMPSTRMMMRAAAILIVLGTVFILPPQLQNPWWQRIVGVGGFDIPKFVDLFGLLCGTPVLVYQGLFLLLFCSGIFYLLRDDFLIGVLVVAIGGAFFFCEMISKEENAVLVSARFGIALIPIAFLLVATGMNGLFEMFRIYSGGRTGPTLAVAVFMGGLFFMSPLWRIYRSPNNFTNHSAYEESYAPTDWSVGGGRNIVSLPPLKKSDVPPFYFRSDELVAADGIIEYPMFIGDYFNPYYYYQVFHKKRVAVGYVPELRFSPLSSRNESVFGDTPIDYVLSRLPAGRRRRRFENMVPLTDAGYLKRKYTRWLLIVHKDPQKEFGAAAFPLFRPLPVVGEILLRAYGPPSYQDEHIVVWRIG